MTISDRMTLANMSTDLGCKNAIIECDDVTRSYLKGRNQQITAPLVSDEDASFEAVHEVDATSIEPLVATPHRLDSIEPIGEVEGTPINKAFLGTCTNGRLEDIATLAEILEGRNVHHNVQLVVVPASQDEYLAALRAGYIETIIEAGGAVSTSSCAACAGIHTGVAGDGDVIISSGNRNMKGRMGSKNAEIYLASPAVVAASCVRGSLADPRRL
jgi:3-isopropylmalate/(R)-2-methylmalate dehydratase large subunit